MIDIEGYKKYLEKLGFAGNSLNTFPSYISENKLEILNQIDSYQNLENNEKLIKFSNERNDFKDIFDQYHSFTSQDTFSDLRSGARRYKHFLQYKAILKTMNDYDKNKIAFQTNGAKNFFKIFNQEKLYPIKAICRKNKDILELRDDFTTNDCKSILKKIFTKNGAESKVKFVNIDDLNQNTTITKYETNIKNIILYGSPGVGKTHSYQKLISLIEDGKNQKEIFDTIKNSSLIEQNNEIYQNIKKEKRVEFVTFHQSYSYEDFIEGFRPNEDGSIKLEDGIFKKLCQEAGKNKEQNYYIIIDEINRGNISKIFGELITLLEEDKRDNLEVTLPYSKESFKIPSNLYIIATMNTTDKSIATIDIALRRRFTFIKMSPKHNLVQYKKAKNLMIELNDYIKNNLNEDYMLGHSYFMNVQSDEELEFVKEYKLKSLLEEYFYADDKKIEEVMEKLN